MIYYTFELKLYFTCVKKKEERRKEGYSLPLPFLSDNEINPSHNQAKV